MEEQSPKAAPVAEYRTLSPVDTHNYWQELCGKESSRRKNFYKKHQRGISYNIYNGFGASGQKWEHTLKQPRKGRLIDFSRIGRLFVIPSHKTAVYGKNAQDALDKTFLTDTQKRKSLKKYTNRSVPKKEYDTFAYNSYLKNSKKNNLISLQKTAYDWINQPLQLSDQKTKSILESPKPVEKKNLTKVKQLQQKIRHERHMRKLACSELKRRSQSPNVASISKYHQ